MEVSLGIENKSENKNNYYAVCEINMGVDYFDCDFCGECTPDCAYESFEMVNIDDLSVCYDCSETLKNEEFIKVNPIEPKWGYMIKISGSTDKIIYYDDWSSFLKSVKKNTGRKTSYGFWKENPKYLKQRFKDALLMTNNFGGMNEDDVRKLCQKIKKRKESKGNSFGLCSCVLYIGFRGHKVKKNDSFGKKKTCVAITLYDNYSDPDHVLSKIQTYAQRNNLVNTPFLITSHGMMTEYDYRELDEFCFPEKNKKISWFESVEQLTDQKYDPDESTQDTLWIATRKYFRVKIEESESKIISIQKRIDEYKNKLEDLGDSSDKNLHTTTDGINIRKVYKIKINKSKIHNKHRR